MIWSSRGWFYLQFTDINRKSVWFIAGYVCHAGQHSKKFWRSCAQCFSIALEETKSTIRPKLAAHNEYLLRCYSCLQNLTYHGRKLSIPRKYVFLTMLKVVRSASLFRCIFECRFGSQIALVLVATLTILLCTTYFMLKTSRNWRRIFCWLRMHWIRICTHIMISIIIEHAGNSGQFEFKYAGCN